MLVDDLVAFDLVPGEVAALRAVLPERLLPLQELALRRGLLLGTGDFVVAGPAGSGKRALAEVASLHATHLGQQVRLIGPDAVAGLLQELAGEGQLLESYDLIIIDGIERLYDPLHGPPLECLLRHLQLAKAAHGGSPRLVAFSGCPDGAGALARYLGAQLVVCDTPAAAPLGVLVEGRIAYREPGPDRQLRVEEDLALPGRSRSSLVAMLVELVRRGEQTVVLWPDAARCVRLAERLAQALGRIGPAVEALAALPSSAPGRLQSVLAETLRHGVAVYTPGLTPRQLALVERAVERGEVRLLCASESMGPLRRAAGVKNLVIGTPWRWQRDEATGRWARTRRDRGECARLAGFCPGARTLIYARTAGEAEELWQSQGEAGPPPPPALGTLLRADEPLGPAKGALVGTVAGLIAGGSAETEAALTSWLGGTFSALGDPDGAAAWLPARVQGAVSELRQLGLVGTSVLPGRDPGSLRMTSIGQVAAECGLAPRVVQVWARWADSGRHGVPTPLEVLCVLALEPGGVPLPLLLSEQPPANYAARLLERADGMGVGERPIFRWLRRSETSLDTQRLMKRALLLHDWIEGVPTAELESRYHVFVGAIGRLAADAARRVEQLGRVCASCGWPVGSGGPLAVLRSLGDRLRARPVDAVAEHQAEPPLALGRLGQSISRIVGALHAQQDGAPDDSVETPGGPARGAKGT